MRGRFCTAPTLTSAVFLTAVVITGCSLFTPRYNLTLVIENDAGGSITAAPEKSVYRENSIVDLTAEADEGWVFESWQGVTTEDGDTATVLMDMNRRVTAVFKPELLKSNPYNDLLMPPSVSFAPADGARWTFMVYLDADNNLDSYALDDFNEIERGLASAANPFVNVVILLDRWQDSLEWTDSRLYRGLADTGDGIASERLYPSASAGSVAMTEGIEKELNMGNPAVLADFISYCKNSYPAEHYALVLWNHGGGSRAAVPENSLQNAEPVSRLICVDEDTGAGAGADCLFMDEVQQALEGAGGVNLLGADACIMGTVEAAYELRQHVSFYAASMAEENVYGWDYEDLFGRMQPGSGAAESEELARLIVDSFRDSAPASPAPSFSAVRTLYLEDLKIAVDNLASALYSSARKNVIEDIRDNSIKFFKVNYQTEVLSQPYYDLNDLCQLIINNQDYVSPQAASAAAVVISELERTVVSAYAGEGLGNYYGSGSEIKRGLSIFFSNGNLSYNGLSHYAYQYWYTDKDCSSTGLYGFLDFCSSDEDGNVESWRELHEAWYDPYRPEGYTPGSW